MITETNVRCFISLAQTLSVAKTTEELSITPHYVTRSINALERRVGQDLFVRFPGKLRLTPAGHEYYHFFSRTAETFQQLQVATASHTDTIQQCANIGVIDYTDISTFLSSAVQQIMSEVPDVQVLYRYLDPGRLLFNLKKRESQLIVIFERYIPKDVHCRIVPLLEIELLITVSSDHPLASSAKDYKAFANEPLIVDSFFLEDREETISRAKHFVGRLGFEPSSYIVSPNRETAYTLCEFGRGCLLTTDIRSKRYVNALCSFPTGFRDRLVCSLPVDVECPPAERMAKLLQKAFRKSTLDKEDKLNSNTHTASLCVKTGTV